jgi:hypothetical protein
MVLAQQVGVHHPERIRIAAVAHLPLPEHPGLRAAALHTGLLGPDMVGLTLGYAVYVRAGHATQRLLSHEFRHVYQYEHAGALPDYLRTYLQQLLQYGYALAPYAVDARLHEQADS